MEAIRALQQQLMEAQKASNVRKISERNCIDLVQKLIATQQVKLFHTSNGKEYLTPEQLDNEIKDCLEACGGRISVTELPNEMGISLEHVEARVEALRKRDGSLHKLNNDLFSQQYLQLLAQEVEESLEESGSLSVADLASRYNLPSEYIRNSVLILLSSQAVVRQNTVHTSSYAARFEARVQGCLRACLQPVILSHLATRHGFDPDLLNTTVQKLIRDEVILGKLQGGAFTPKAYTEAEAKKVDSFFDSNGFLTAAMVKACNLTLKEWVSQRKVEGGSTLLTAFVSKHLVDEVQAAVAEALAANSWIDVQPLLPPSLAVSDAAELLLQLSNQKKLPSGAVLLERVAASSGFLQGIAKALEGEVQQAAEKSMKPRSKKEDEDGDSKKRKVKGKSQKKRGEEDDAGDDGAVRTGESGVNNEAILNHLADQHPGLPFEVQEDLCVEIQRLLVTMVSEIAEKLRSSLQTKQKQQFEEADKLVQERYEKLVLGLRALEVANEKQDSPLYQQLLRDVVIEPFHALIALRLEEATGTVTEVTAANRKQCLEKLTTAEKKPPESLQRLLAALAKKDAKDSKDSKDAKDAKDSKEKGKIKKGDTAKDADNETDISDLFHAAADDSHIFCRKVDKKREKAAAQEQRMSLKERLKETTPSDATSVCHLGLQLALNAEGVSCLVLPSELWALKLAAGFLKEEVRELCLRLCELCEKGDAVEREAAAAEWRNRFL